VQSDGLIEKVRTNLVLQSEAFNTTWAVNGIVVTANTAANPLTGTTTADTITADAANNFHLITQSITYSANENTVSVYVKANGYTWFLIDPSITNAFGYFNVTTGAVGTKGSACTTSISNVGGGWYRCSVTFTASAGAAICNFSIRNADNGGAFLGDGVSGFFVYGAQVETGVATDYIPTTTAAVSVGPVANVPRLDYLNSSCPRLLLEPQRSNLATYSEQANQYTKAASTIGSNVVTSPDGYTNADSIIEDGTTAGHAFYNFGLTTFTAAAYTASVFAKKGGRDWFALSIYDSTVSHNAYFNLNTGTIGNVGAGVTATITNYGNGWYRCSVTATTAALSGGIAIYAASVDGTVSYAGTNGLAAGYFYGWQLELGAYATSYIPTLGASVTRVADAATKTGISALIGQTEGTIFWEFEFTTSVASGHESIINIDNGSYGNTIYIIKGATSSISAEMYNGAVLQASFTISSQPAGTYKAAFGYANNNTAFFLNGVQIGTTDTSCSVPTTSRIQLGNNVFGPSTDKTAQLLLFPTRLTNAQLAELTA
jgi:hypothetical protein